jgi:pyruvate,water dikinase
MAIKNPQGSHTILIETDPKSKVQYSLNEEQLRQLHNLGLTLENAFNYPQDIEWAIEKDVIFALQTRPITTLKI